MTKKKTLQQDVQPEFQDACPSATLEDKEEKALLALNRGMRRAALLGGFSQIDIYETLIYLQEDSPRFIAMKLRFIESIEHKTLVRLVKKYMKDKS